MRTWIAASLITLTGMIVAGGLAYALDVEGIVTGLVLGTGVGSIAGLVNYRIIRRRRLQR